MSAPTLETTAMTVDFTDRFERRRRRWRIAGIVVAGCLAVAVAWLVWFSPVLSVKVVRAVGVVGKQADAVVSAAAIPIGTPIARVDADAAAAAILGLPWVSSVDVRRGWPSEIVLAVTSRSPIAIDGATGRAVDADGVVFEASGPLAKNLPKVTAQGESMTAAMAVLGTLPVDLSARVASMSASTRDSVDLVLRSGAKVHWGSADQAAFKAEVLRALLRHRQDVYDVSAPELPTTFSAP